MPDCSIAHCYSVGLQVNHKLFAPKKVYFYWTERDQTAPVYLQRVLQVSILPC